MRQLSPQWMNSYSKVHLAFNHAIEHVNGWRKRIFHSGSTARILLITFCAMAAAVMIVYGLRTRMPTEVVTTLPKSTKATLTKNIIKPLLRRMFRVGIPLSLAVATAAQGVTVYNKSVNFRRAVRAALVFGLCSTTYAAGASNRIPCDENKPSLHADTASVELPTWPPQQPTASSRQQMSPDGSKHMGGRKRNFSLANVRHRWTAPPVRTERTESKLPAWPGSQSSQATAMATTYDFNTSSSTPYMLPPAFLLASAFLYHINCHLTTTGVHMWSQSCSIHWVHAWAKSLGAVGLQGGRWTPAAGADVAKPTETKVLVWPHPTCPRISTLAL